MRKYLPESCEKSKPGAPEKLTEREMITLVNIVSKDPSRSAPKLADMMNYGWENKIRPQTVRGVLKEQNFKAKKKIKRATTYRSSSSREILMGKNSRALDLR